MKLRLLILTGILTAVAPAAFGQWIACSNGSTTCTSSTSLVGVGNTTPIRNFVISGSGSATFQLSTRGTAPTCCDGFQFQQVGINSHLINIETGGFMAFWTNATQRVTIDSAGNMGIGTTTPATKLDVTGAIHATGVINADGGIAATYQDLAEWVPGDATMKAGTVVVISDDADNHVVPSSGKYATDIAGVISAKPGILLGVPSKDAVTVATTGRVKVFVSTQNGPIQRGDLLVTSDTPGVAMRSKPITVNGHTFHKPGTIIGKALEPLASGSGEILVLLSMQ